MFVFVTLLFFLVIASPLSSKGIEYPIIIDLNHPHYQDGMMITHKGGIVSSPNLKIQAKHIIYTHKVKEGKEIRSIYAEGDLFVEKDQSVYVGEKFLFDFQEKRGVILGGKTAIGFWFLSGEAVEIQPKFHFSVTNAQLTTSETTHPYWSIQSRSLEVEDFTFLQAKSPTTVRVGGTPVFYLPPIPYRINLKPSSDSSATYTITQDKGLYPLFGMRYRLYTWKDWTLFLALNIRPTKGVSGAFESSYLSPTKRAYFLTRNYLDYDTFYQDPDPDKPKVHYRLQGVYSATSANHRSTLDWQYDHLSDKTLQTNFVSPGFKLETNKESKLSFRHVEDWSILSVDALVRLNTFQTMKQELPTSLFRIKPISLGNSGIIFQHAVGASYLTYVFANTLEQATNFESARIRSTTTFYRPFSFFGIHAFPYANLLGIFYSHSQRDRVGIQGVARYGIRLHCRFKKSFPTVSHTLSPYLSYQGITKPTLSPEQAPIFSIEDGYQKLQLTRFGVRQWFVFHHSPLFLPNFLIDTYAYAFFHVPTFQKVIPKVGMDVTWNFPTVSVMSKLLWNQEVRVLDTAEIGLKWTISKNCAIKTEFRHRSPYRWRNNSPRNFVMEATRTIPDLLASPLSDGRNVLLTKFQIKLHPQWIARLEAHIGWGRNKQPSYTAFKADLFTTISTSWQLHATLIHSPAPEKKNTRFLLSLSLGAKPNLAEKLGHF